MRVRLSVRPGPDASHAGAARADLWRTVDVVVDDGGITLGRMPGATLELPFATVSARHARIVRQDGGFRVEDLGSANGTRLGARLLQAHVPLAIAAGEILDVGGVQVRFDGELPDGVVAEDESSDGLARRLVHDIFAGCAPVEAPRLVAVAGPGAGGELALLACQRSLVVGRGESCDWVLCDPDVSREHAAIERSSAGILLRDLGSKNGVMVRGRKVEGACRLHDGDLVCLGQTSVRVIDPEERYLRQIQAADLVAAGERPTAHVDASPGLPPPAVVSPEHASHGDAGGPVDRRRGQSGGVLPALASIVAVFALLSVVMLVLALAFGS